MQSHNAFFNKSYVESMVNQTVTAVNNTLSLLDKALGRDPGRPGAGEINEQGSMDYTPLYIIGGAIAASIALCCGLSIYRGCRNRNAEERQQLIQRQIQQP